MITNPYIGLRSYEESDAAFFKGRSKATADLYELLVHNDFVVFHSESGEGKSSLINAGLCPILRDERYFPVRVSFTDEDFNNAAPDFDEILCKRIADALCQANDMDLADIRALMCGTTQNMSGKIKIVPLTQSKEESVFQVELGLYRKPWWLLRNYVFEAYGVKFVPVLLFDQFEEVFTRPVSMTWTEDFFQWLQVLSTDICPDDIIGDIRSHIGEDAVFPVLNTVKRFKALFSLRNEYMGDLDYWGVQRHFIATLKNSRYCLKPLTIAETDEVLSLQSEFTPDIKSRIKQSLSIIKENSNPRYADLPSVSALLLSVVCDTLSSDISKTVDVNLFLSNDVQAMTTVIRQFYDRIVSQCAISDQVRAVIESVLVDAKGKRVRVKSDWDDLAKIRFEEKYMSRLIDSRLIKCSKINGDNYIELTHDVLAKVIFENRRSAIEARKRKRESMQNLVIVTETILAIGFVIMLFAVNYFDGNYRFFGQLTELPRYCVMFLSGLGAIALCRRPKTKVNIAAYAAVTLLLVFSFGRMYIYSNGDFSLVNILRTVIWLLLMSVPLIPARIKWLRRCVMTVAVLTVLPLFCAYSQLTGLLLFAYAYFIAGQYGLVRDRNALWIVPVAVIMLFVSFGLIQYGHFWYTVAETPLVLLAFVPLVSLLPVILNAVREHSAGEAVKYCVTFKILKDIPAVLKALCCFVLALVMVGAFVIGLRLSDKYALIYAPILSMITYICVLTMRIGKIDSSIKNVMVMLIIGVLSFALVSLQYINYGVPIAAVLMVAVLIAGYRLLWRRSVKAGEPLSRWSIMAFLFMMLMFILVPTGLSMGYDFISHPSYARVYGRTVDLSRNTRFITMRGSDGKIGLRDRSNVVIPAEFDSIDMNVRNEPYYSNGSNSGNMPDITCYTWLNGEKKSWHCIDHLDMNNICSRLIVDRLKSELEYRPDFEKARVYLNYLKSKNEPTKLIEQLAAQYITDMMVLKVNAYLTAIDKPWIQDLQEVKSMAKELDYNVVSGDFEQLLPYANPQFARMIFDDIQANAKDWRANRSVADINSRYSYKHLLSRDFAMAGDEAKLSLSADSTLLTAHAVCIMAAFIQGDVSTADSLLKKNAGRLLFSHNDGQPLEPGSPLWHVERYNTVGNELRNYIGRFSQVCLLDETQASELGRLIDRYDPWTGFMPFTCIQKVEGRDDALRFINTVDVEPYSYFVEDGKVVSPYISLFALPVDVYAYYHTPVLIVDRFTGKRIYITSPLAEMPGNMQIPVVLSGEYDHAWRFSEDLAAVEVDGRIGFINTDGQMVISPQFYSNNRAVKKTIYHPSVDLYNGRENVDIVFRDGLCPVADGNGRYGLIDKTGNWVVMPAYDHIGRYDEPDAYGYRRTKVYAEDKRRRGSSRSLSRNARYGLLDSRGNEILPVRYSRSMYVKNDTIYADEGEWDMLTRDLEQYNNSVNTAVDK